MGQYKDLQEQQFLEEDNLKSKVVYAMTGHIFKCNRCQEKLACDTSVDLDYTYWEWINLPEEELEQIRLVEIPDNAPEDNFSFFCDYCSRKTNREDYYDED